MTDVRRAVVKTVNKTGWFNQKRLDHTRIGMRKTLLIDQYAPGKPNDIGAKPMYLIFQFMEPVSVDLVPGYPNRRIRDIFFRLLVYLLEQDPIIEVIETFFFQKPPKTGPASSDGGNFQVMISGGHLRPG